MAVRDRWHLSRPSAGAQKCGKHRKVPSAEHGQGLQWQVRGLDDHGQPVKRNFEFQEDAEKFDTELKAAVRAGTYVDDKAGQVTFREFAEQWRKSLGHGHSTAERVERSLRNNVYAAEGEHNLTSQGRLALGDYPMAVLSRRASLIRQWMGELPLQANAKLLLADTVKAVFKAAVDDRIIGRNPFDTDSVRKSRPKRQQHEVVAWTIGQVDATAAALRPERLAAMAWLGACSGLRQGEMFALDVSNIDLERRTVRVEATVVQVGGGLAFGPVKNRKKRTVPVSRHVMPLLAAHRLRYAPVEVTLPWSEKGNKMDGKPVTRRLLFTDTQGRAYYRQTVNRSWRAAWKSAGVPDLGRANGMHVLRHTAASTWLSEGLNPAKVAAWLGDTVDMVTTTYAHWLPQDDERGREIMDRFLAPAASIVPLDSRQGG